MIKSIKSALMQITSWKTDLRVIMAFLFGFTLLCIEGFPYLKFAAFARSDVQAMELFVLCGSTGYAFLALFLGNLLLMSNAPFVTEATTYEILRIGKKRWIDSKIIYIVIGSVIYSLVLILASVVFSCFKGTVNFRNEWSYAMTELTFKQPSYAITSFRVSFTEKEFISAVNPYVAALLTVICNSAYSVLICMVMMTVNLLSTHNFGWIAASVVHILGYAVFTNSGIGIPLRFSLFCNGMPASFFKSESGFTFIGAGCFFLAMILILREVCFYASKKMQV
ncbi:MAG: hypothetical protein IKX08_05370 [Lachnospiraceae bacterium]|nr:hypothetical protein [Lachnospiraceae bacterium]